MHTNCYYVFYSTLNSVNCSSAGAHWQELRSFDNGKDNSGSNCILPWAGFVLYFASERVLGYRQWRVNIRVRIAAWLDSSLRSRDHVRLNMFARE